MPTPKDEADLVEKVLSEASEPFYALDPFCGSGSVPYACAMRGWNVTGLESNPFLRWAASVRSNCFSAKAAEFVGYAWERVAGDVFWENEQYRLPEVSGTYSFGKKQTDYLRRVRLMIDREKGDENNNLLRMAFCHCLEGIRASDEDGFDDRVGADIFSASVETVREPVSVNPKATAQIHLCDSRDMPYTLRRKYDLIVSSLPEISPNPDAELLRTYMQWIGFVDFERTDGISVGYPLGDFDAYMGKYVPDRSFRMPSSLEATVSGMEGDRTMYVRRYFEGMRDYFVFSKSIMTSKCTARYIVRDGEVFGKSIPVAEILAEMIGQCGLRVAGSEKEGQLSLLYVES